MEAEKIKNLWIKIWADMNIGIEPDDEEMEALIKFAEISFKAGKQTGRKEVAEWIDSRLHSSYQDMWEDDWQAQVKDWEKEDKL